LLFLFYQVPPPVAQALEQGRIKVSFEEGIKWQAQMNFYQVGQPGCPTFSFYHKPEGVAQVQPTGSSSGGGD
jgi:hypothetical protein